MGGGKKTGVLVSFESPWKVAKGGQFDVECRDGRTGDGAFLVVADLNGRSDQLQDSFILNSVFGSFGRYSAYGTPTDLKVKSSTSTPSSTVLDVTFSIFSQSTNAEIPRRALITAKVVENSAVMLVAGSTKARWKQVKSDCENTSKSFVAVKAPESKMRSRARVV